MNKQKRTRARVNLIIMCYIWWQMDGWMEGPLHTYGHPLRCWLLLEDIIIIISD